MGDHEEQWGVLHILRSLNHLGEGGPFGCSRRPVYGMIWVSVPTLRRSGAVEGDTRGIRHKTPSMDFCALLVINWFRDFIMVSLRWRGQGCLGCTARGGKTSFRGAQFSHAAYRSGAPKGPKSMALILETLWPCWGYKRMLKLKVAASFQVLTIEQKAQPTLVHLLKLVKIKMHSRLSSCHSRGNYYIGDGCLNWSCSSAHLFKDMLGNFIYVSQDSCPVCGEGKTTASCLAGGFSFVCSRQTLGAGQIDPE